MNYLDVLDQLENTSGSNEKERILRGAKGDERLVKVLDAALSFSRKFFIKQIPEYVFNYNGKDNFDNFMNLLNRLETRTITGDAARLEVKNTIEVCHSRERLWFTRILLKDLRCGFGISTCNKAGFNFPEFELMLAKDGKGCKKIKDIISKGVWVSKKFDGYRCLAIVENGEATLYTRNGKVYENFPQIQRALVLATSKEQSKTFVFDGEVLSNSFGDMQRSAFASKRGTTVGDVTYHIFDLIPADEWRTQRFTELAATRFEELDSFFSSIDDKTLPIVKVEHFLSTNYDEILGYEQDFIKEGYEGAMILPNIPYYVGRKTNAMMKFKTMQTMDCKVVGLYEGSGKNEGSLGGIQVVQENGLRCDVGSGFDDNERTAIFNNPNSVVGRVFEVKYQNLSEDGIMRFPIFVRWRPDKDK